MGNSGDTLMVLDREFLRGFTAGDPDLERHLINVFIDHAPSYLENLQLADGENWQAAAHKLKGAARSVGAFQLAEAAEKAETIRQDDKRREALAGLENKLQVLCSYVESIEEERLDDFDEE